MSDVSFPSFVAGALIDPSELEQNFRDVVDLSQGLTSANVSKNAGLTSRQIADRFATYQINKSYLPRIGATSSVAALIDLSQTPALWTTPNNTTDPLTEIDRIYFRVRGGKEHSLVAIEFYAQAIGGTGNPKVCFTHNGTILGGGSATVSAAGTKYTLANSATPFSAPYVPIQDGDYISIHLGRSGSTPTLWGLNVSLTLKGEIGG